MVTLPLGGAQISHQGALLEGKDCCISAVGGLFWLILWWMVGVGHGYHATRWRPDLPQGGAARVLIKRAMSAELASNASDGQMTPFCMCVILCE